MNMKHFLTFFLWFLALAAKARGVELPVVAAGVDNPVLMGLAVSMARPGGRITGVSSFGGELVAKRIAGAALLEPGRAVARRTFAA